MNAGKLPSGYEAVGRSFGEDFGWSEGIFSDRAVTDELVPEERGPRGGVVLRTRRWVEDSPSLDGTQATVGTYDRVEGTLVRCPSRAVNVEVRACLASADGNAQTGSLMVDGFAVASCTVPAEGVVEVEATAPLTRRACEVTWAPELGPSAGDAVSSPVRDEAAAVVELVSLSVEERPREMAGERTVFIASDSLAQTYTDAVRPQAGWGEYLARYLGIEPCLVEHDARFGYAAATRYTGGDGTRSVVNAAMAARSARSFIAEGKLGQVLSLLGPGDVLLIQFGANDATRARPLRYSSPAEFMAFLERYIDSARDRGAIPVVVTPPPRYRFDAAGAPLADFVPYAEAERELCRRTGTPCIDLAAEGARVLSELGPQHARALYLKLSAGQYPAYPEGVDDSTHLSQLGARVFARIVAKGVSGSADGFEFHDEEAPAALEAPRHLAARSHDDGDDPCLDLSWEGVPGAAFYTVARRGGDAGCVVVLEPRFRDQVEPGRPDAVTYEVQAWGGRLSGPAAVIEAVHAFAAEGRDRARHIVGVDLYEVDAANIADSIGFSVRFRALAGVSGYRVLARNAQTGQRLVLGRIAVDEVDGLHGYRVTREPGWRIFVEGDGKDGLCTSDEIELPWAPPDAEHARASWEVPF